MHFLTINRGIEGYGHFGLYEKEREKRGHIYGLYFTPHILGFSFGKKIIKKMIETVKIAQGKEINLESTLTTHDFYKPMGF
jgi:hypothetical protein